MAQLSDRTQQGFIRHVRQKARGLDQTVKGQETTIHYVHREVPTSVQVYELVYAQHLSEGQPPPEPGPYGFSLGTTCRSEHQRVVQVRNPSQVTDQL